MFLSTSTGGYATRHGRTHVAPGAHHQGEVLEAPEPGGEPDRDAGLLLRADARAAAERQAGGRRRRHREEAARTAAAEARAERRQARDAGAPGRGREP